MKNRVGIVTFHQALSYGAVLQCYALQNFLKLNGIDNDVIDYQCDFMNAHHEKIFVPGVKYTLRSAIFKLMTYKGIKQELANNRLFTKKYLALSKQYTKDTISECSNNYDYFISGSDQVWSPTCVGFDPVYFLTFAKPEQKYTYAASIGTNHIPDNIKDEFTNRIKDFSGYSMRETSGANIVKELVGKDSSINIDPTLLLNKDDWDKVASKETTEPYIFLFTVLKPKNLIDYAIKLAKEKHMKIIYLNKLHTVKNSNIEYMNPVTADRFVGLIKNASYVCTNSFHGNAFSIIYHKNFVVETDNSSSKRNIRSEELMKKLGLNNRIMSTENTAIIEDNTDWNKVDLLLKIEQEKSRNYLTTINNKFI